MQTLQALRGGSHCSEDNFCKESLKPPAAVSDPLGGPKRGWPKVRPLSSLHAVTLGFYKGSENLSVHANENKCLDVALQGGWVVMISRRCPAQGWKGAPVSCGRSGGSVLFPQAAQLVCYGLGHCHMPVGLCLERTSGSGAQCA